MKKTKYQKCGVGSHYNRVIEMSRNMFILKRIVPKNVFFLITLSRKLMLNIFKNGENNICFNHVIGLNQKMLILNRLATEKNIF